MLLTNGYIINNNASISLLKKYSGLEEIIEEIIEKFSYITYIHKIHAYVYMWFNLNLLNGTCIPLILFNINSEHLFKEQVSFLYPHSSHLLLVSVHPLTSSHWAARWARHAIHVTWPIYPMNGCSQGSWRETRAWRRFALSFAGRSKKRGQTKRSIFVAFSKRPCSLFRRGDEKREKRRKKIRGTLKRIPSGRSEARSAL